MLTLATLKLISAGALLGLTAGVSPGPLLTLVITQTLRYNRAEGIKIALSPLITDAPVILLSLLVFSQLSQFNTMLAFISFAGAVFIAMLGFETFKTHELTFDSRPSKTKSLKKGIITNFLNPHPYLFWVTVGTPLILQALGISVFVLILFLLVFYVLLIGAKITIVCVVFRSRQIISNGFYVWLMRILGIILFVFALLFVNDGISYLRK